MERECQYCKGTYCDSHRLPEQHDCDGVRFLSATGKRFETKTGEVITDDDSIQKPQPIEPAYTVGNTPEYEDAPSPDTELKDDPNRDEESRGLIDRLRSLLGL